MRWRRGTPGKKTRVVFATDLHGSERCFKKWINSARVFEADCLVMGGDITGKAIVPMVETADGWRAEVSGNTRVARDDDELRDLRDLIRAGGRYDVQVTQKELDRLGRDKELQSRLFRDAMVRSLRTWFEIAEDRLPATGTPAFFMLGNDDDEAVLAEAGSSEVLRYSEDGVCELPGGHPMVSFGFSNPTPWKTPRELDEDGMAAGIRRATAQLEDSTRAIYNFHCPPRDTPLDQAAVLDDELRPKQSGAGSLLGSVGSSAVREAIECDQPLLGLHGHVHECAAVQRLGSTLCVNAGSEYQDGVLKAAILDLEEDKVRQWQLISS